MKQPTKNPHLAKVFRREYSLENELSRAVFNFVFSDHRFRSSCNWITRYRIWARELLESSRILFSDFYFFISPPDSSFFKCGHRWNPLVAQLVDRSSPSCRDARYFQLLESESSSRGYLLAGRLRRRILRKICSHPKISQQKRFGKVPLCEMGSVRVVCSAK